MTNALTKKDELAALVIAAHSYADSTITPHVRAEYNKTFARFVKWCADMGGLPSLPSDPQTVVLYFTALADGLVRVDWTDGDGHAKSHQRRAKINYIRRVYTAILHASCPARRRVHPGARDATTVEASTRRDDR